MDFLFKRIDNFLSGSLPSEVAQMVSLEHMVLQSNNLSGSLPSEVSRMKNLQTIYLGGNLFSGTIPFAAFGALPR